MSTTVTARTHGRLGSVWRYALALTISLVAWGSVIIVFDDAGINDGGFVPWLLVGDSALGVLSFVLMHWRHRWPGRVMVVVTVVSSVSAMSAGPSLWMIGSLSQRRRWRLLMAAIPLNVMSALVQEKFYPGGDDLPLWATVLLGLLIVAVIAAVGHAMGSQRDLLVSLRERAETAEREQQARVAQAQTSERTRIAREMHDVLAHRISLVAMHAGALSYRTDLTPQEQSTAARAIEENAHQALTDLRSVLGVLRDPMAGPGGTPEQPQPVISDLPHLVEEERSGGMRVVLESTVEGEVAASLGRTAYRIVQEALTNARKHAPGTAVTVNLSGNDKDGLTVLVRNAATVRPAGAPLPRSGLGLIGIDERVALAGGRFHHGTDPAGGYVVEAWLPWHV